MDEILQQLLVSFQSENEVVKLKKLIDENKEEYLLFIDQHLENNDNARSIMFIANLTEGAELKANAKSFKHMNQFLQTEINNEPYEELIDQGAQVLIYFYESSDEIDYLLTEIKQSNYPQFYSLLISKFIFTLLENSQIDQTTYVNYVNKLFKLLIELESQELQLSSALLEHINELESDEKISSVENFHSTYIINNLL